MKLLHLLPALFLFPTANTVLTLIETEGLLRFLNVDGPSADEDKLAIKKTLISIEEDNYDIALQSLSYIQSRYTEYYIVKQLYRSDNAWFDKLVRFCNEYNDKTNLRCLRGLIQSIIDQDETNDTYKVTTIAEQVVEKLNIEEDNTEAFDAYGDLRNLQKHSTEHTENIIENHLKMITNQLLRMYQNLTEKREGLIRKIWNREFQKPFPQNLEFVYMRGLFPDFDQIFIEVFNCSNSTFQPITEFILNATLNPLFATRLVQILINSILRPLNIYGAEDDRVLGLLNKMDYKYPDRKQDLKNETNHLVNLWLNRIPLTFESESLSMEWGFNLTTSQIKNQVVEFLDVGESRLAEYFLFNRLTDVEHSTALVEILEQLKINDNSRQYGRYLSFISTLEDQTRITVVIRALIKKWKSLSLVQIIELDRASNRTLTSILEILGFVFDDMLYNGFSEFFHNHREPTALIYFNSRLPPFFKESFQLFIVSSAQQERTKTDLILYRLETLRTTKDARKMAIDMYIDIFTHDLQNYNILRLVFGFKRLIEEYNKSTDLPHNTMKKIEPRLSKSALNIIAASVVCLDNSQFNLTLGVNISAQPFDMYRRDVGLYKRKTKDIKTRWIITKPDLSKNVYLIQNAHLKEFLITSIIDFDQDRRQLFTWMTKNKTQNAEWELELVNDDVTIKGVQWGEYLYGGRIIRTGQVVMYAWRNLGTKYTYENQVPKKGKERVPHTWHIRQCDLDD